MLGGFDESLHPRAQDGKFGAGSGGGKQRSPKASASIAKGKAKVAAAKATIGGIDKINDREGHFLKAINGKASAKDFSSDEAMNLKESIRTKLGLGHDYDLRAVAKAHAKAGAASPTPKSASAPVPSSTPAAPEVAQVDHTKLDAELAESTRRLEEARAKATPAKPPSATSLQKAAGVPSKSVAGQAIKAHVAAGDHEKASALAAEFKQQREAAKATKAAEKQAAADLKQQREATRATKAAKTAKAAEDRAAVKAFRAKYRPIVGADYNRMKNDFSKNLDDRAVISEYSSRTDRRINGTLRETKGDVAGTNQRLEHLVKSGEDKKIPLDVNTHIGRLDAVMANTSTPRDMAVHRVAADTNGMFLNLKPGQTFTDHGYTSTSQGKKIFKSFEETIAGNPLVKGTPTQVNFVFGIKKGSRAAAMENVSQYKHEKEILLPRGGQYKVSAVAIVGGVHTIYLEN